MNEMKPLNVWTAGSAAHPQAGSFRSRAEAAADVARRHADDVDAEARFPAEAIASLKEHKLMGIMVPVELGGEGASMGDAAEVCYVLGQACASAGMIYAMHLVKVACIVNHGMGVEWQEDVLRRLVSEQLLFASSTTEGMGGGNVRSSAAGIVVDGDFITLDRDASVISYGLQADGLVTTARRAGSADAADQVLAVFLKSDYDLSPTGGWNALGMRGTCSDGFRLKARGRREQLLPLAYERIHSQTMIPAAHILWSSVWAGIAAAAVAKAQVYVRRALRGANGQMPPGGIHLSRAHAGLRKLRSLLASAIELYERCHDDARAAGSIDYQTALTMTKADASELAVETVMACYRTCGLAGYRNDGDVSIGRHLRDVLSSPIMISNDRIMANMAGVVALSSIPQTIRN